MIHYAATANDQAEQNNMQTHSVWIFATNRRAGPGGGVFTINKISCAVGNVNK